MGGLDQLGHFFGLLVGLHVLSGIVRQVGVARRIPIVQLHTFGAIKGVGGDGEGQPQNIQSVRYVLFTHVVHEASVAKACMVCQFIPTIGRRSQPVLIF